MTSPYSFQALRSFCQISQNTIVHNLNQFNANQYISIYVTPIQVLELQTTSRFNQFRVSMIESFLLTFSLIQNTIQSNALLSSLQTNYKQFVQNNSVLSSANIYRGCNCASSSTCVDQSAIYTYPDNRPLFLIPGFYMGCSVIQSLLQSNLKCFYDQGCIDALQMYLSSPMNMTALSLSSLSMYSVNSTINDLLTQLMVEQSILSISYKNYYDQCQPTECTYSVEMAETVETIEMVETRNDVTYIIALIIGVIGGVITILKLIVPRFVKFIVYHIQE
ncbi:unnamed protein product [Adineta steineri]|uniref:Transmembrane protein n=1 Tax=Adineta steineri TaxID=433720 RepID=A0A819JHN9_9BILA|nr:unnamed protein product [Adineta steineri]CAF1270556.1 unnamed protein product [Adineta steineri]CAF3929311.1 unnamed protein product [Adineta steineri]CAF4081836.1 unnamed protein product [Adineta steineri]